MKVIVINGYPRSGKDKFVEFCTKILIKKGISAYNISTIDRVKEIAQLLRWNGVKDSKSRKFLSDLKDLYREYCDGPLMDIVNFIDNKLHGENDKNSWIFVHCRESKEIDKIKYRFDAVSILIRRFDNCNEVNHADLDVGEYWYDYIIENKDDLEVFMESCKTFINDLIDG